MANTYYSNYKGEQIDSAFEAIKDIIPPSSGARIVVVTSDTGAQGGPVLKASAVSINSVGKAEGANADNVGNFVQTKNSSGDMEVSAFNSNSFLRAITAGTPGDLVKVESDGSGGLIVADAGFNGDQIRESVAIIESFAQEFEAFKTATQSGISAVAGMAMAAQEDIDGLSEVIREAGVAYDRVEEPDFDPEDGTVGFVEGHTDSFTQPVYIVENPEDEVIVGVTDTVTGYGGVIDPNLIYAEFKDFNNVKLIDSLSIPKLDQSKWQQAKNNFPIWTKNGTLKDSGISYAEYQAMVAEVTALRTVVDKLISQGVICQSNAAFVSSTITADNLTVTAFDSDTQEEIAIAGYTEPLVQLYTFDGSTAIYPRTY